MRSFVLLVVGALLSLEVPRSWGEEVEVNGLHFTVPGGFTLEEVQTARGWRPERPVAAAFDESGSLYVAEQPVAEDGSTSGRIIRLEDSDGDGSFEKRATFADGLGELTGLLWARGLLYAGASSGIWRLLDEDSDGRADVREQWTRGEKVMITRGPCEAPDGSLFWVEIGSPGGAERNQETSSQSRKRIWRSSTRAFAPEAFAVGGPGQVGALTFTPEGELFAADYPAVPGKPEGARQIVPKHVQWQGASPSGRLREAWGWSFATTITSTLDREPAWGDLIRYRSNTFGKEYLGNLLACAAEEHSVSRYEAAAIGAGAAKPVQKLVQCASDAFRPVGLVEDADGSVIILDAGGPQPDDRGALYRLRRLGVPEPAEPWRTPNLPAMGMHPLQLAVLLTDPRPAVAQQALERLARIGPAAIRALTEGLPDWPLPQLRQKILWTLARMEAPEARAVIRKDLVSPDAATRQTAAKIVGWQRDAEAVPDLLRLVREAGSAPGVAAVAAEALGRVKAPEAVGALLQSFPEKASADLEQAFAVALAELGDAAALKAALQSPRPALQRLALLAGAGMAQSPFTKDELRPFLESADPGVRAAAVLAAPPASSEIPAAAEAPAAATLK